MFNLESYAKRLEKEPIFTKRGISSLIPSIFDVHGLISQYVLRGKVILSRVLAYKTPEPSPTPACTNNDVVQYETPSPDVCNQNEEPEPRPTTDCTNEDEGPYETPSPSSDVCNQNDEEHKPIVTKPSEEEESDDESDDFVATVRSNDPANQQLWL